MATADDALNVARSRLGAGPDEFWNWYGGSGYAWCCAFQSWVLSAVGIPTHYAWVSGLFNEYRNAGRTLDPRNAQPGDLIAFDYDGNGAASYDHIAMVESVTGDGIVAINGNWTNKVCRVLHRWGASGYAGGIAEAARPTYSATPQPSPEEDDDVKSLILWDPRNGRAWHAFGNTKVYLSHPNQVAALKFLGAVEVGNCSPDYIDSLATLSRDGGWIRPDQPTPV